MKYSTNRKKRKVLKILLSTKTPDGSTFYINDNFYNLFNMKKEVVNQSLNALAASKAISIVSNSKNTPAQIKILQPSFSYLLDSKESSFRFWFPVTISIFALILSAISILMQLI